MVPKGIRNNNPGNIEHGDDWLGLANNQKDARFCTFARPKYGIRAICKILFSYNRRGVNTIAGIVRTWAPPHENPTQRYIENVSNWTGLKEYEKLDLKDEDTLVKLCKAIARQENGTIGFKEETYQEGVRLALRPKNK